MKNIVSDFNLTPITDNLKQDYIFVDNEIQASLEKIKFHKIFKFMEFINISEFLKKAY